MKCVKDQKWYALVIVLLMVVLFLSISATFIAGSLNHAKQERTVDTSNQAVASAEMGVVYYTEDFERTLEVLREELVKEMQDELDIIASCDGCNTTFEKTQLDQQIKEKYISTIKEKVNHMDLNDSLYLKKASEDGDVKYTIDSAQSIERTNAIEITLNLKGEAKQGEFNSASILSVVFDVEVPDSFIVTSNHITYDDVYKSTPSISCNEFLVGQKHITASKPYDCKLGDNKKLSDLIKSIEETYRLNPADFRVFTDKYLENVCNPSGNSNNCNKNDFKGISVVVSLNDSTTANMNNLSNLKLYVSGKLIVDGNLNNGDRNVIVLKELEVRNNIQNLEKTTLVVLGYEGVPDAASFEVGNNISLISNSRICMDIDLIKQTDLTSLTSQIKIDNTSSLLYYTSTQDPNHSNYKTSKSDRKTFSLSDAESNKRVELIPRYTDFLKMCGVNLTGSHSVPNVFDTGFKFEVEY